MLKTKVILSNVTNLSDARYASGMGVDFIGFMINPNNHQFVTHEAVKMITDWLSGVKIIGDIEMSEKPDTAYPLDLVQTKNPEMVNELDKPVVTLPLSVENITNIEELIIGLKDDVTFFVLLIENQEIKTLADSLKSFCEKYPIYISTEYHEATLEFVLSNIKPEGIVIYGSTEEKPGLSSYDGIADILEQLEIE